MVQGLFLINRRNNALWADSPWWLLAPLVTCVLLFLQVLRGEGALYWGPADSDLSNQFYPWQVFIQRWISRGVFPFWDPHVFGGYPTIETQQMLALNPIHLMSLFLRPEWGMLAQVMAHTLIAGMGMAIGLRRWGAVSALAAAVGGVLYVASGLFAVRVMAGHMTVIAAMAWWPLAAMSLFGAVSRAGRLDLSAMIKGWRRRNGISENGFVWCNWNRGVLPLLGASAVFHALVVLAGGPQYIAYLFYVDAAIVLTAIGWTRLAAAVAMAALIWTTALLLSAPQWLPSLWYLPYSGRAMGQTDHAGINFTPLQNLWLEFLMPFPFGDDLTRGHLHFKNVWETATYPGAMALALMLAVLLRLVADGIATGIHRLRHGGVSGLPFVTAWCRRTGLTRLGLAALLMIIAGLYMIIGGWVPGFGGFRDFTKARAVVAFGLALLSAAAVDGALRRPAQWWWAISGGAIIVLVCLLSLARNTSPAVFLALIQSFGWPFDPAASADYRAALENPLPARADFLKALRWTACWAAVVLAAGVMFRRWARLAGIVVLIAAMADLLFSHSISWRGRHAFANATAPQEIIDHFAPKLKPVADGQQLPWRVILHSSIINRTHHVDGFYEVHGYDPLMPAFAVGRMNIQGVKELNSRDNPYWRLPLMERTGVRFDAGQWFPDRLSADDASTGPRIIEAPAATLYDVSRNVQAGAPRVGIAGPSVDGTHFLLEYGPPVHYQDNRTADEEFRRIIAQVFPPRDVETTGSSTLLDGEWVRPAAVPHRPDEWAVRVNLHEPALVVLKMTWLPGWRVVVDGSDAGRALFVNNWMVGAIVPAGEHEVLFRYRPVGWRASLAVSGVGVVFVLIMIGIGRRHRRGLG